MLLEETGKKVGRQREGDRIASKVTSQAKLCRGGFGLIPQGPSGMLSYTSE